MIRIGEFSKLAQVSIATLRYYDQVGLLKPVSVDGSSCYRYYTFNQLPRLNRILALKGMGFSLDNIADLLKEGLPPEQMRGMLRMRQAQINQQLAELQGQLREVEVRVDHIEREGHKPHYDVILKQTESQLVASVRAILPVRGAVSELFKEVYDSLGEHVGPALGPNPGLNGQTLVLWYDTEYKETDFDGAAAFFLRCPAPEAGRMRVHELAACQMATVIHHGSYNRINEAHEAVIAWIEANNYRVAGADREIDLYNTMPIDFDDPTYITEIQYPVERVV